MWLIHALPVFGVCILRRKSPAAFLSVSDVGLPADSAPVQLVRALARGEYIRNTASVFASRVPIYYRASLLS